MLLWSIYPNIGIDKRNQIEMIEQLPGGVAGVRQLMADFQRRGVRVLFPIMPWDTGTHALPGTLADSMVALMKQLGADGVNGDTMTGVPEHYSRSAERIGYPLVFEPEIAPKEDQLGWNLMSWGYFDYFYPLVNPGLHLSKFKWLEPRHMVHVNDRWQRNREDMLQSACELQARATADGRLLLNFDIEPKGFAAVFAKAEVPDEKLSALRLQMQAMTAQPLASFDHRWQPARQQMRVAVPTEAAASAPLGGTARRQPLPAQGLALVLPAGPAPGHLRQVFDDGTEHGPQCDDRL